MPRFDGSYPNFGLEYSPSVSVAKVAVPQAQSSFVGVPDGNLASLTSTGSRSLDPVGFVDLVGDLSGGVTATVAGGLFGTDPNHPMGFTCPDLILRSSGSGMRLTVQPSPGAGWWIEVQFLEGGNGYCARLESNSLKICRVDAGVSTVLKSTPVGATSSDVFSFVWDGNQRYQAFWGNVYVSEVDDSYSGLGSQMRVVSQGGKVSEFIGGVVKKADFDAVDAPYRNVFFTNILYYDGVDFPWVADSGTAFNAALQAVTGINTVPFVTLAYCKPSFLDGATPGVAPSKDALTDIVADWGQLVDDHPSLSHFIVWKDNQGFECGADGSSSFYDATPGCMLGDWDYPRYRDLFQATSEGLRSQSSGISVYGPNCHLSARGEGFDTLYGGVTVDSRDMGFLQFFLDDCFAATPLFTADGLAISGSFTSSEWELLIPYLKDLCAPLPLIVTSPDLPATPTQSNADDYVSVMNDFLDEGDVVFYNYGTDFFFHSPRLVFTEYDWTFTATLSLPSTMMNARLKVVGISDKVLRNGAVTIISDGATPYHFADELPVGNGFLQLGDLEAGVYSITVFGDKGQNGNAMLRIGIYSDNFDVLTLADTRFLGSPSE